MQNQTSYLYVKAIPLNVAIKLFYSNINALNLLPHQKQNPIIYNYLSLLNYYLATQVNHNQLLSINDLITSQDVICQSICKKCSRQKQRIANELYHANIYAIKYYFDKNRINNLLECI